MNEEKKENYDKAAKAWAMINYGKTFSQISKETGLHKSEISNIKKFTFAEMYISENYKKKYIVELLEKRKLLNECQNELKRCRKSHQFLRLKLEEYKKRWVNKLIDWVRR